MHHIGTSRRTCRTAIFTLALILISVTPASAAPINDDRANRLPIQLGVADTRTNVGAGVEPNELFTTSDPAANRCDKDKVSQTTGSQMDSTLWWEFTGNGGPVTVSSARSNFDSVLAVYETASGLLLGCNDDIQPFDDTQRFLPGLRQSSEMVIPTVAGRLYSVQLGKCTTPPPIRCGSVTSSDVVLRADRTPPNDDRAAATPITAGEAVPASNIGATLESQEPASCGSSPYAKTVWFRYSAPARGTAVFLASGREEVLDTVLAVYRADAMAPLGCNDDAVTKQYGSSRLPSIEPANSPVDVLPGDYLIQVGGYYDPNSNFTTVAARSGKLNVRVDFTEDTDIDNDGSDRSVDCNDNDPAIRPGTAEIANNDIDENCDAVKAFDRDGDGVLARPVGADCRDDNPGIRPDAPEIPDNGVDEDCDGADKQAPLLDVTIGGAWLNPGRYTQITSLYVKNVPAGTTVRFRCRGKGCPFKKQRSRTLKRKRAKFDVLPKKVRSRVKLRPGARVEIIATKPGFSGKSRAFRIRRGLDVDPTSSQFCLWRSGKLPC